MGMGGGSSDMGQESWEEAAAASLTSEVPSVYTYLVFQIDTKALRRKLCLPHMCRRRRSLVPGIGSVGHGPDLR